MSNSLKISVLGLDMVLARLQAEGENIVRSMEKAHSKVSSLAVKHLKAGLDNMANPDYKASPKGALPYKHSGRLQASIGNNVLRHGFTVKSEVGSGTNPKTTVEYAKWLEGRKGDGIRPFLWAVQELYIPEKIIAYFETYYKPLSGGKQ